MSDLDVHVDTWLGGTANAEEATVGELRIQHRDLVLTEVLDTLERTTRPTIRVSASLVAEWLVCNYWRLAFEPRPSSPATSYAMAHSMAAIGSGYAWPDLEISGDGETVELVMRDEDRPDVSAIRYLRRARVEISRASFEGALATFVTAVRSRLSEVLPGEARLAELWAELEEERADSELAQWCRLEARAGFDSGESTDAWRRAVELLLTDAGEAATEDLLGVAKVDVLSESIAAMKASNVHARLPRLADLKDVGSGPPWERGRQLARAARQTLTRTSGPITNEQLGEVLELGVPFVPSTNKRFAVEGARRTEEAPDHASLLFGAKRASSQRFYLARLLGMAILDGDRVLPITSARTSLQKINRAFAQEFLLPWEEVDAWTDEHGLGAESIASLAEQYDVSELLVESTLVNHQKVSRSRLAMYA